METYEKDGTDTQILTRLALHTGPRVPTWEYRFGNENGPARVATSTWNAFVRCYLVK